MAMLKPDNLFQTFGIILLLLASIGVISFTSKFIFGFGKTKVLNIDQIYDPDHNRNITRVCPFATNTHRIRYNRTVCFNKTLNYRYIPWMYYDVWKKFNEINEEKRIKRLERLKTLENNETRSENVAEEMAPTTTETPANRKTKDEPSKVVCTILAALLVISSAVAFCEVFRDKCMNKAKTSPRSSKQSFPISELSSNEQTFQSTAKVTQTLVHQTSLDRAFSRLSSEGVKPLFRRSSVPAQMMSSSSSGVGGGGHEMTPFFHGYSPQINPSLSDSPETRRKSRHFIRRH